MDSGIWSRVPPDILEQILSLLPLKTLIKLRSTSRYFNSIIYSPSFISKYSSSSSSSSSSFLLFSHPQFHPDFHIYDALVDTWHKLSLSRSSALSCASSCKVLSTSNGLLCFPLPNSSSFLVCNILSRSSTSVKFPSYPFEFQLLTLVSEQNGYKLFMISPAPGSSSRALLYDYADNQWREFKDFHLRFGNSNHQQGVCHNSRLYFSSPNPFSVVYFNLKTGNSGTMMTELPSQLTFVRLASSGSGNLLMFGGIGLNGISRSLVLWELNEEGNWIEIVRVPQMMCDKFMNLAAFSDCNSDRSGEFPTTQCLLISRASDDLIVSLVSSLGSCSIDEQKQAAMEIRLLAKSKPENRTKIAQAGAIKPLISLISSSDHQLQEYGVTAILNLSLCDENKEVIASLGAIKPLVRALRLGTPTAKENAACTLLRLSQIESNKIAIGRSGAIPLLVTLLETGSFRGKKDASTALYSLCSEKENKTRAVKAGVVKVLVELMADSGSNMVDKSGLVMSLVAMVAEGRAAVVEEGGIPVLVEMIEVGSQRQKEIAAGILLQISEDNLAYRTMVAREGSIPPLVALSQSGTTRAKQKAETLIMLLRRQRSSNGVAVASYSSAYVSHPMR